MNVAKITMIVVGAFLSVTLASATTPVIEIHGGYIPGADKPAIFGFREPVVPGLVASLAVFVGISIPFPNKRNTLEPSAEEGEGKTQTAVGKRKP